MRVLREKYGTITYRMGAARRLYREYLDGLCYEKIAKES